MKKILFLVLISITLITKGPKTNHNSSSNARVADLVSRMALEENISYINGTNRMYTNAILRLGIQAFKMKDGPVGVELHGKSTAYPASIIGVASRKDIKLNKVISPN